MRYYSTNLKAEKVSFERALIKGLAEDRGLYMPETIPTVSLKEIEAMRNMTYPQIAFVIARKFLSEDLPEKDLAALIDDAYDYPIPLEPVSARQYVMRLDQGPTASFKDFAARLMGRWMHYYLAKEKQKLTILTATSGDTGSAIANAFYGLDNIQVMVLFPVTEVTARQRKQMTTLGKNIRIIGIRGKFDDCQALVKRAFSDPQVSHLKLSSANSINIGRLLPQSMYYFYAYARLMNQPGEGAVFSIPSGNFGDMMGGMIAKRMGLPISKFVIATNSNDEFPKYMTTGQYKVISPSRNCISSAMNVGHPSNVSRLIALYGGMMDESGVIHKEPDRQKMCEDLFAVSIGEAETEETICRMMKDHNVLLEPHGAVGWRGLEEYLKQHPEDAGRLCVSLETAHPAKFPEKIIELLGIDPPLPPSLENLETKPERYDTMDNNYSEFVRILKQNYEGQ